LPEEVEVVRVTLRRLAPQWSQAGSSPQDSLEPEGIIFGGTRSQIKVKEERTGDEAAKYRERLLELFAQHPGRSVTEEDIAAVVMEKLDLMAAVDLAGVVWTKLQPYLQGRRGEFKTRDKFLQLVEVIVDNLRADKRRASQSKPPEIPFDEEKPIRGFLPELEEVSLVEIMTAWGKLTPAQQQAMRLHLIQGFTIPVAAQLMERLEGAVKGLIHRGKTSLRWFILHPESLTRVDRERKPTTNGAPPKVLAAAMDKLKPGQREVLKLAEKLSNKALGERLEISTDAAAGRLKKARANLIWYLEHPGEERRRHTRKKPRPEPTYIEIIVRLIEQEKGKAIPIEDLQTKLGLSRDAVEVYIYRARRAGHHITTIRVPKLAYRLD
jgi:DNA-directed RNA polymerase specialized sigma24 family protein